MNLQFKLGTDGGENSIGYYTWTLYLDMRNMAHNVCNIDLNINVVCSLRPEAIAMISFLTFLVHYSCFNSFTLNLEILQLTDNSEVIRRSYQFLGNHIISPNSLMETDQDVMIQITAMLEKTGYVQFKIEHVKSHQEKKAKDIRLLSNKAKINIATDKLASYGKRL